MRKSTPLFLSLLLVSAVACRSETSNNPNNPSGTQDPSNDPADGGGQGSGDGGDDQGQGQGSSCPTQGISVCTLKMPKAQDKPAIDSEVTLDQLVVTSPSFTVSKSIKGFYVADMQTSAELNGRWSGILVTYKEGEISKVPQEGAQIQLKATYKSFYGQLQLAVKELTEVGTAKVTPVSITSETTIATDGADAAGYEGVLVNIANVQVTVAGQVPGTNDMTINYAFKLSQLIVGSKIYRDASKGVAVGNRFKSLTGILRIGSGKFESGVYALQPRNAADMVREEGSEPPPPPPASDVLSSVAQLADPAHADYKAPCQDINNGTGCAKIDIKGLVVTAVQKVGKSLHVFVQDPNVQSGKFSGLHLFRPAELTGLKVGDGVDVTGTAGLYYGHLQVKNGSMKFNASASTPIKPVIVTVDEVARDKIEHNPYENVLITVEKVTVSQACVGAKNNADLGDWAANGDKLLFGHLFPYGYNGDYTNPAPTCGTNGRKNDQRKVGDDFQSITGVTQISWNFLRIEPRSPADLIK